MEYESGNTNEVTPVFYVGQHESKRSVPVTADVLQQAQDCNVCSYPFQQLSCTRFVTNSLLYSMIC